MHFTNVAVAAAALSGAALAQNSTAQMSICDKYTVALLTNNTATNQYTLLTLLVNTVGIGNFTGPGTANPGLPGSLVNVPGILAPGTYNGEPVNLVPYFSGALKSTNRNNTAVSVNFLDGGGAAPIIANPTSSGATGSNQYKLFTHLYAYFGAALGCSQYSQMGFPAYMGAASQYSVHKYMDLDTAQVSYFIEQVGLAAASFGVTTADVTTVANLLNGTFGYKCAPAATVIPAQGAQLQAICQNATCPTAPNATCGSDQPAGVFPALNGTSAASSNASMSASSTLGAGAGASTSAVASASGSASASATKASGSATGSATGTATGTAPAKFSGAATKVGAGALAAVAGFAAFVL